MELWEIYSSTADERISMVKLTAKGVELVEQINQSGVVTLARILNAFSEDELHNLNHQLKKNYLISCHQVNYFHRH